MGVTFDAVGMVDRVGVSLVTGVVPGAEVFVLIGVTVGVMDAVAVLVGVSLGVAVMLAVTVTVGATAAFALRATFGVPHWARLFARTACWTPSTRRRT